MKSAFQISVNDGQISKSDTSSLAYHQRVMNRSIMTAISPNIFTRTMTNVRSFTAIDIKGAGFSNQASRLVENLKMVVKRRALGDSCKTCSIPILFSWARIDNDQPRHIPIT